MLGGYKTPLAKSTTHMCTAGKLQNDCGRGGPSVL